MKRHDHDLARRLYAMPELGAMTRDILNGACNLSEQAEALAADPSLAAVDHVLSGAKSLQNTLQRLRVQLAEEA